MSDVFISYARSTEPQAEQIAAALRSLGYTVWRDDELPPHRPYADVIEERLRAAKAVVVVWSADAVQSQWVRAEADVARMAGTLVQLSIDGATPPLPFNQIQCVDLAAWSGDPEAPAWRKVAASAAELVASTPVAVPAVAGAGAGRGAIDHSVCVLPFANMSDDPQQEYFSDGISDDIITDLSKVAALFVIARNTAFTFKGQNVEARQLARQLNVAHVLEGSVRKAGNRVRISAQLIDGATGRQVWAERFDRDLDDIFALQDEISEAIVTALKVKLLPEERQAIARRGTDNVEAYNLYLMARQYLVGGNQGNQQAGEAILRLCLKATELDPGYAQAWALMALAQTSMRFVAGKSDDGLAAAEKALSLDADLAEAHAVRARHLHLQGAHAEAFAEIEVALSLDAGSFEVNESAGLVHFKAHRFEDAARYYEKAAALSETAVAVCSVLTSCYSALGDHAGVLRASKMVLARAELAVARDPGNGSALGHGAAALIALGEMDRAREWIGRALLVDPGNSNMRYNFACALSATLKDIDGALEVLGPWFASATAGNLHYAAVDSDLDPLRSDPRYLAMVATAEARLAGAA